jgi:hypothetical protein
LFRTKGRQNELVRAKDIAALKAYDTQVEITNKTIKEFNTDTVAAVSAQKTLNTVT